SSHVPGGDPLLVGALVSGPSNPATRIRTPRPDPTMRVVAGLQNTRAAEARSGPTVWPRRAAPTHTATTAPRCSSGDDSIASSWRVGMNAPSDAPWTSAPTA